MATETEALVLDLVEWVAARPRPYTDVMEAWRTNCPRLTIWEDAIECGYVVCGHLDDGETMVYVTPSGRDLLARASRLPDAASATQAA